MTTTLYLPSGGTVDVPDDRVSEFLTSGYGYSTSRHPGTYSSGGVGGAVSPVIYTPGRYIACGVPNPLTSTQTQTLYARRQWFMPFDVLREMRVDRIALQILTTHETDQVRLGVYSSNPETGLPDEVKIGSPALSVAESLATHTVDVTLDPGRYWASCRANNLSTFGLKSQSSVAFMRDVSGYSAPGGSPNTALWIDQGKNISTPMENMSSSLTPSSYGQDAVGFFPVVWLRVA